VPDKRCDNGHFIDESWDLCPYCPASRSEPPVVRPRKADAADEQEQGEEKRPPLKFPEPASRPEIIVPRRAEALPTARPDRTVTVGKAEAAAALSGPRYVVAWLVGLSDGIKGESFPVRSGRNILGRDRKSDIYVNDDQASSHHADLVFRPDERRFIIMDHNSTNGTYVNEREIEPRRDLGIRDIIRIGTHRYLFFPLCGESWSWDNQD